MTPDPNPAPLEVVTLICTTAGLTFSITASRTCSVLEPVSDGIVIVGLDELPVLLLLNCQPAKRPVPKTRASSSASPMIEAVRTPLPERRGGLLPTGGVPCGG